MANEKLNLSSGYRLAFKVCVSNRARRPGDRAASFYLTLHFDSLISPHITRSSSRMHFEYERNYLTPPSNALRICPLVESCTSVEILIPTPLTILRLFKWRLSKFNSLLHFYNKSRIFMYCFMSINIHNNIINREIL